MPLIFFFKYTPQWITRECLQPSSMCAWLHNATSPKPSLCLCRATLLCWVDATQVGVGVLCLDTYKGYLVNSHDCNEIMVDACRCGLRGDWSGVNIFNRPCERGPYSVFRTRRRAECQARPSTVLIPSWRKTEIDLLTCITLEGRLRVYLLSTLPCWICDSWRSKEHYTMGSFGHAIWLDVVMTCFW